MKSWKKPERKKNSNWFFFFTGLSSPHCKYLQPNYDQITAYGCTTTAIQSKIVMLQNVNKHWRALLERPLEETIQSNWGPSRIHQASIRGLLRVLQRSNRRSVGCSCQWSYCVLSKWPLQMTSPNNLSMWALQCLFTFWNITILDCNSNHLVLYSILSLIPMSTMNIDWHPTTNGWNQKMAVGVQP